MKKKTFAIGNTVVLIALFALDRWPNKYLANSFVLVQTWASLQATIFLATWATFATKLPSPSTINWAIELTRQGENNFLSRWFGILYRTEGIVIALVAMVFGQWWIMCSYALSSVAVFKIVPTARAYLRSVTVDFEKKTAIIDV